MRSVKQSRSWVAQARRDTQAEEAREFWRLRDHFRKLGNDTEAGFYNFKLRVLLNEAAWL